MIHFLTLASLLLSPASPVRVMVLPLFAEKPPDERAADDLTRLLQGVISQMDGVDLLDPKNFDDKTREDYQKIFTRCGKETDCQQKIGTRVGAQIIVSGRVGDLGSGVNLHLDVLDVGSGKPVGRVTRTMANSSVQRAAALEEIMIRFLFPDRLVGSLDLFLKPPGAKVLVDGQVMVKEAGPQVHLKNIRAGQHTLRISRRGYSDFYAIVQVPFTGTTKLDINMRTADPGEQGAEPAIDKEEDSRWYERWWVWTILGILVAGATTSTILLTQ